MGRNGTGRKHIILKIRKQITKMKLELCHKLAVRKDEKWEK